MRWSVNSDATVNQSLAKLVNIIYCVGEVAKVSALIVFLRIPIVRKFYLRLVIAGRGEKHQSKSAPVIVVTPQLPQPEFVTVEIERFFEVCDPHHRM